MTYITLNFCTQTRFKSSLKNKKAEYASSINFKGNPFNYPLRDTNTQAFDILQKQKVELIIKMRDASAIISRLNENLQKVQNGNFSNKLIKKLEKDISDAQDYKTQVLEKLQNVNLSILKEEEKNY